MSDPRPDTGPGLLRALGALAVGSVLAFVAFGQPWVTLTVRETGLPAAVVTVTGRDLAAAPGTMPVLLLALVLVIWATGGWLRRAVGVLVVVVSAVVLVAAVRGAPGLLPPDLQTRYGLTGVATYDTTFWWLLAAAGAFAALAAGVLTTVHRGRWSGMAGRYERASGTAGPSPRKAGPKERSAWDQLDSGTDPTEPAAPDTSDAGTMTASATPPSAPAPSIEATGADAAATEEDLR